MSHARRAFAPTSRLAGKPATSKPTKKPAGLTEAEVRERMLTKLQSSGLAPKDAAAMKLEPCTKAGATRLKLPSIRQSSPQAASIMSRLRRCSGPTAGEAALLLNCMTRGKLERPSR